MYEERDDYEHARRLLAPLAGDPTGPSSVDIRRAVADGRRRLRTRQLAGVGAVAVVIALSVAGIPLGLATLWSSDAPPVASTIGPIVTPSPSPSPFPVPTTSPEPAPEPPTSCELELPPLPADALDSFAFGTDPTGRIVHGRYSSREDPPNSARWRPVLWIDGELIPVDIPGNDASIKAVNSSGVAVGTSVVGETEEEIRQVAWIYRDGVVTELPGEEAEPFAITEDGVVLGTRASRAIPVVWRSPEAAPEDLPIPGYGLEFIMSEMLPDGTVVGFRYDDREQSFIRWPDGTVQDIPLPRLNGERYGFRAQALNGHLLVGEATQPESVEDRVDVTYTAIYDLATGQFTVLSEDAPINIWVLNRHGWIAGEADGRPGLWTPEGGLVRLPDLGVHGEDTLNQPHSITDDGRTLTGDLDVDGRSRAVVWRCD